MENLNALLLSSLSLLGIQDIYNKKIFISNKSLLIDDKAIDLALYNAITIIGLGKASAAQVSCLYSHLHSQNCPIALAKGLVITKFGHGEPSKNYETIESAHPVCDDHSFIAGEKLIKCLQAIPKENLLIFCLSGGASSLATGIVPAISKEQKLELFDQLLHNGADILTMNKIRRSISTIKNGGVSFHANCKAILTLAISDIPSSDFSLIGSGPTTFVDQDSTELIALINNTLTGELKDSLIKYIKSNQYEELLKNKKESLKKKKIHSIVISDYKSFTKELIKKFAPSDTIEVEQEPLNMDFEQGIKHHLNIIHQNIHQHNYHYISGGELPVIVKGDGKGGRNSEFVVRMALELFENNVLKLSSEDLSRIYISSLATDGTDGPTEYAGGWITYKQFLKAKENNHNISKYLDRSDSLSFLKEINAAYKTGPTGTNIMDLRTIHIR